MTFKEKLVRLRKLKALTQDEFASAVGVSRQAVYKWESGQSYPEVPKLLEIKMLFGISIDDLLDETYEVEMPEKKRRKRISRADKERIEKEVLAEENALDQASVEDKADNETVPAAESDEPVIRAEEADTGADVDGNIGTSDNTVIPDESAVPSSDESSEAQVADEDNESDVSEIPEESTPVDTVTEEPVDTADSDGEPTENGETVIENTSDKETQKKGFFARLFGKK